MEIIRQPGKKYSYVFSAALAPIVRVKPGQVFAVETQDAFEGRLTSPSDRPSEKLVMPYVNPQTGPIYVEGAAPGDTLVVEIKEIKPRRNFAVSCLIPNFGGLVGTTQTRLLHSPLEERVKLCPIKRGKVFFDHLTIPYRPFYGTLATAPEIEAVASITPGSFGGNMDVPSVCPGNKVYLPVKVAAEFPALGTLVCHVLKGESIAWPRIESPEHLMVVGSARPLEDACRIAYTELIEWLKTDYGFDRLDAYQLLTLVGKLEVGNMVDTFYSVAAKFPKRYLPPK